MREDRREGKKGKEGKEEGEEMNVWERRKTNKKEVK